MSSPDLFEFPTERTEFSDTCYSAFGRALTLAARFEANCRSLAVLLGLKAQATSPGTLGSIGSEEEFQRLIDDLWDRRLVHHIQAFVTALHLGPDLRNILSAAREARNYLAHEFALGIEHDIETDTGRAGRVEDLATHALTVAKADALVCLIALQLTDEALPTVEFIAGYPSRVKQWVCEF